MKNMTKIISLIVALALILSLAACGGSPAETSQNTSTPASTAPSVDPETGEKYIYNSSTGEIAIRYNPADWDFSDVGEYTFTVSAAINDTHGQWVGYSQPIFDFIEEVSGGKVTFDTFTGGELVESGLEYRSLMDGVIDIAAPIDIFFDPTYFPCGDFSCLPMTYSDPTVGSLAFADMVDSDWVMPSIGKTYTQYQFEDIGLHVLVPPICNDLKICTTGIELDSLDAFSKININTSLQAHTIFAEQCGMSPVQFTVFELYDAMSRGAVNATIQFIADWQAYGTQELIRYCLADFALGHAAAVMAFDKETWDAFPQVLKDAFEYASDQAIVSGSNMWLQWRDEAVEEYSAQYGTKFVNTSELPEDVQQLLEDAAQATWRDYIESNIEENPQVVDVLTLWIKCAVDNGGEFADSVYELMREYGADL